METDISSKTLSEVYGFIGNSLLKPMSQTLSVGIDPEFWATFPNFGDADVSAAVAGCSRYATTVALQPVNEAVERVSVEFTRLFVGPPSPAAPPWETFYRSQEVSSGFGEATFEMRRLLREMGLELSNENRQYEDHIGIELLYLSELCCRATLGVDDASASIDMIQVASFIREHPLGWAHALRARVQETSPEGYFDNLLALACAALTFHVRVLEG